jgi:hypothetical protein
LNVKTSLPVLTMLPHLLRNRLRPSKDWRLRHEDLFRQPNRRKIHQRVVQAVTQFAAEEWPGLLVTMRDMVQSVWRTERIA